MRMDCLRSERGGSVARCEWVRKRVFAHISEEREGIYLGHGKLHLPTHYLFKNKTWMLASLQVLRFEENYHENGLFEI